MGDNQGPVFPHAITFGAEQVDLVNPSPDVTVDPNGARHAIIASTSDSTNSVHHRDATRTARAATSAAWRDTFPRHFPEP